MTKRNTDDKLQNFVIWLDGFLDACPPELNISKTNTIKNKLNDLFKHEAEPVEAKYSLEELGEQHGFDVKQGWPNKNDDSGVEYRC